MQGRQLHRKCHCGGSCGQCRGERGSMPVPRIVHDVLRSPGQPLDATTRTAMEPRFGHDFSQVRVHAGARERQSAMAVDALAYAAGNHIVLGDASLPREVLTHELAHVTQHRGGDTLPQRVAPADAPAEAEASRAEASSAPVTSPAAGALHRYRPDTKKSFHHGLVDDPSVGMVEEDFTDEEKQPWIASIDIIFTGTTAGTTDKGGTETIPKGELLATYAPNPAALPAVHATITGGSPRFNLTHIVKNRKLFRIEGFGYNHVPFPEGRGQGPKNKYAVQDPLTKLFDASMHYALFFKGGQALHTGSLDSGSHACVHADVALMRQINYHSVLGRTVVNVDYAASALNPVCCELFRKKKIKEKGEAPEPCHKLNPKVCRAVRREAASAPAPAPAEAEPELFSEGGP